MTVVDDDLDLEVYEKVEVVRSEVIGPLPEFKPICLGPIWERDPITGRFALPEHTLGWDIIAWCAIWLRGADGEDGWRFTLEQARIVLWMYAIDEHGDWLYRDVIMQFVKGFGKDPIAAVICAVELLGPCRPGGWNEDGTPIAVPLLNEPWIQIIGVSRDNTKNCMMYLQGRFTKAAIKKYDIEINKGIIYALGGTARIEVVTSSPHTMEGNRPSLVVKGEPHHWLDNNQGLEVDTTADRNVTKNRGMAQKGARTLSITNAYNPSENSVAQRAREGYEAQVAEGIHETLYISREAPEDTVLLPDYTRLDENQNRVRDFDANDQMVPADYSTVVKHLEWILVPLRSEANWLSPRETAKEILKPDSDMAEMRRFYLNSIVTGTDAYLRDDDIRATVHPTLKPLREGFETGDVLRIGWGPVDEKEPVVMFFDGSKSDDSTALVGCRVSDGYFFLVGLWEKPKGQRGLTWLSPRPEVDSRVHEAFARFNIIAFWADPSHTKDDEFGTRYWDGLIDAWHIEFGEGLQKNLWAVQTGERLSSIMWDMASPLHTELFSQAVVRFADEMDARQVVWDGHPSLRQHLRNARRAWGRGGLSIRKPARGGTKKIDAAVCAIGAKMLARLSALKGIEDKAHTGGTVWW